MLSGGFSCMNSKVMLKSSAIGGVAIVGRGLKCHKISLRGGGCNNRGWLAMDALQGSSLLIGSYRNTTSHLKTYSPKLGTQKLHI